MTTRKNKTSPIAALIMCKQPVSGQTKTRLSPPLSPRMAAELYRCFLLDSIEIVKAAEGVDPILAFSPAEAEAYFQRLAPDLKRIPQIGADLGSRLVSVLTRALGSGYSIAMAIISDGPTLPSYLIDQAVSELENPNVDIVFGPGEDGGYYLVACKTVSKQVFLDVHMSTETVLKDSLAIAENLGLNVRLLPQWYDVDLPEDLARLQRDLGSNPEGSYNTRQFFIQSLGQWKQES